MKPLISRFIILSAILAGIFTHAFAQRLSDQADISLLTASPGQELYSVFGHSALRVNDPLYGIDEVYNYGTFDFDTPNFYIKFFQGKLLYKLSVTSFRQFLWEYDYEGREVVEQRLNLTHNEKEGIYDFLQINRLPENAYYHYDFFYDNCATRIRDLIDQQLATDWGDDPHAWASRSFRDMLQPYVGKKPWAAFGIDIVLGLPADKTATPWDYMFLPDEMYVAFAQARHADGRMLLAGEELILEETQVWPETGRFQPAHLLWIVFLIGVLSLLRLRWSRVFDKIFFSAIGFIGIIILFLWFLSDHQATGQNLNLLWAIPTHLYFIFSVNASRHIRLTALYFGATALISLALIAFWNWFPQDFHPGFLPVVALAALKSWSIARKRLF
jgi:hypothetical protein